RATPAERRLVRERYSSWKVDANIGQHARTQIGGLSFDLRQNLDGSAGRIDHWADVDHLGSVIHFWGCVGRADRNALSLFHGTQQVFRKRKFHLQWRNRGDPEQAIPDRDALADAHIAASDHAIKRRHNSRFFYFQVKSSQVVLCRAQVLLRLLDFELRT